MFPIIYLGRCLVEKRPPRARDWSLAVVPAIPVLIHVLILAGAKSPQADRLISARIAQR